MGEVELKEFVPCPFCNCDNLAVSDNGSGLMFNVHCGNCRASGPWERCAVDAKDAWNTRAEGRTIIGTSPLADARQALKDTSNAE
jgi:hypothetical protein